MSFHRAVSSGTLLFWESLFSINCEAGAGVLAVGFSSGHIFSLLLNGVSLVVSSGILLIWDPARSSWTKLTSLSWRGAGVLSSAIVSAMVEFNDVAWSGRLS